MMLVPCRIGRSAIDGLGVFAAAPVAAGALVWRFTPPFDILVAEATLAAAPEPVQAFYRRFAYELPAHPGHVALDGDDGRFMNHADRPNLDIAPDGTARAVRPIAEDEEFTCDYRQIASRPFGMEPARTGL
jgi:SET domain-containing protein